MKPIAIIVAVPREAQAVLKTLYVKETYEKNGRVFNICSYRNKRVVLVTTGVGIKNARQGASTLIQNYEPSAIISIGYAGAVIASFKKGDVLMADGISYGDNPERSFLPDKKLFSLTEKALAQHDVSYNEGKLVTVSKPLITTESKKSLGEGCRCQAVDMETAALAQLAQEKEIPFLSLRVILDDLDHNLKIGPGSISNNGHVSMFKILKILLFKPRFLPGILRLTSSWIAADRAIRISIAAILSLIPEDPSEAPQGQV